MPHFVPHLYPTLAHLYPTYYPPRHHHAEEEARKAHELAETKSVVAANSEHWSVDRHRKKTLPSKWGGVSGGLIVPEVLQLSFGI